MMEQVTGIREEEDYKVIVTTEKEYECKSIILATGVTHRHLGVPGEERLTGAGVSYCATCDGMFFRGRCDLSAEGCSLEEYGLLSCTLAIDSRSHPCSSATNDSNIINPHIFSFPNKLFLHFLIAVIHFSFTLNCNMFQSLLTYFWTYLHRLSLPRSLRF